MADKEFGRVCQQCHEKGGDTFARMYYKPINNKWLRLCGKCWNAVEHSVHLTGLCVCPEDWSIDIHGNCSNCGLHKTPRK